MVLVVWLESGECIERTRWEAPDIDGVAHVLLDHAPGTILKALVIDTSVMDLHAETVEVVSQPVKQFGNELSFPWRQCEIVNELSSVTVQ